VKHLPPPSAVSRRTAIDSLQNMIHADGGRLTYRCLLAVWRKGLRNGNWSRLDVTEKALIRCALWVARVRGSIWNMRLMVQVLTVLLRLVRNCRSRIADAGNRRAQAMLKAYATGPNTVFRWIPQLREWLRDPRYVCYLGLLEVNG
jgi:hypothetical protein